MGRANVSRGIAALATAAALALAGRASAEGHIFSYEPASAPTRALTQTGLSFEFEKGLLGGARVRRIIQTGEIGSADLKPSSDAALGRGGLAAALGRGGLGAALGRERPFGRIS